jgi:hypothetical protein
MPCHGVEDVCDEDADADARGRGGPPRWSWCSVVVTVVTYEGGPSLQSRPGLLKVASCHAARPTERGFKKYINVA